MEDLLNIKGRVAMVWGGGAGIGEATVDRLVQAGCAVGVVDIDGALAEAVAQKVRAAGGKAIGLAGDVREEADVDAAVSAVQRELGVPTLSASVVGVALFKPLLEMSGPDWESDLTRNLKPAFLIGRRVARAMIEAGEKKGAIAFVCSISGLQSAENHASYGAAKAGMRSLVQTMALEWGRHGIRVNAVAPGPVRTVRIGLPEIIASVSRRVPLGRMAEVDEIAKPLVFLLSDMAGYMTGQTIVADGGWLVATPGADVVGPDRDTGR
jgi:NAD(P)-dependent dehydrogenase (short-subunit alcohol dehydrogenase family)